MGKIVVIGASQGGVTALQTLVANLGADFPAPILVTLHIGAGNSLLPGILEAADGFSASFAQTGEAPLNGHIYVAPPDRHLLVLDGVLSLSQGPRENYARPAIDPMFRSAALVHGPDVIGVVLSGGLNDGTAGLLEIKRRGGIVIVQTPAEAESPDMPRSALENVAVDFCVPIREMPRLLNRLVREASEPKPDEERSRTAGLAVMESQNHFAEPVAQTCPECGGAMRRERSGPLICFRCHIGHVMTAEVMAAGQIQTLVYALEAVLRRLNERVSLCSDMAEKYFAAGNDAAGERWRLAGDEARGREAAMVAFAAMPWRRPESPAGGEVESEVGAEPDPALAPAPEAVEAGE